MDGVYRIPVHHQCPEVHDLCVHPLDHPNKVDPPRRTGNLKTRIHRVGAGGDDRGPWRTWVGDPDVEGAENSPRGLTVASSQESIHRCFCRARLEISESQSGINGEDRKLKFRGGVTETGFSLRVVNGEGAGSGAFVFTLHQVRSQPIQHSRGYLVSHAFPNSGDSSCSDVEEGGEKEGAHTTESFMFVGAARDSRKGVGTGRERGCKRLSINSEVSEGELLKIPPHTCKVGEEARITGVDGEDGKGE